MGYLGGGYEEGTGSPLDELLIYIQYISMDERMSILGLYREETRLEILLTTIVPGAQNPHRSSLNVPRAIP